VRELLEIFGGILVIVGVWHFVRIAVLLYALNVFLAHFGRTKIPLSFKTLFAAGVMQSEIRHVLSKASK
jgi:hypothetical protein